MDINRKAIVKRRISRTIIWTYMVLFSLFQFFPMIWVFCFSLCKDSDLFTSTLLKISSPPNWENYRIAFVNGHILKYFTNSVIVTGTVIILTLFISLTLSYAIVRMRWKLNNMVFKVVLLAMMIPIHTTLLPNYILFKGIGILDTPLALIVPYTAFSVPTGVFIMTGFIESVPFSLEESAVLDGCTIFQVIMQIVLPLVKSALVTVAVITFLSIWNEFIVAATYLSSETWRTLPFSVYEFAGKYRSRYAVQFAVMVMSTIPSILVYAFLNQQITKGITFGAVKG